MQRQILRLAQPAQTFKAAQVRSQQNSAAPTLGQIGKMLLAVLAEIQRTNLATQEEQPVQRAFGKAQKVPVNPPPSGGHAHTVEEFPRSPAGIRVETEIVQYHQSQHGLRRSAAQPHGKPGDDPHSPRGSDLAHLAPAARGCC